MKVYCIFLQADSGKFTSSARLWTLLVSTWYQADQQSISERSKGYVNHAFWSVTFAFQNHMKRQLVAKLQFLSEAFK